MKTYNFSKILQIFYFTTLLVVLINRLFYLDEYYGLKIFNLILSIFFICLCFVSFHFFLKENKEKNNFPFLPLIVMYLLVTYGFSYELIGDFLKTKSEKIILKSFFIINLAIIFLNLGYYSLNKFFQIKRTGFKSLEVKSYSVLVFIASLFLLINFLNKFYNFIPLNLNQTVVPIVTISCSIYYYSIINHQGLKKYIYIYIILVTIFLELLTSSYVFPASLALVYFVIYFITKRTIPILSILIFVIFFFTLHLFKSDFRSNLLFTNLDPIKRSKIFIASHFSFFSSKDDLIETPIDLINNPLKRSDRTQSNNWRIAHSYSSLIFLVEKTPSSINYLNGETYKLLLSKFIPRIIWKDKPLDTIANSIGRKYNVLNATDRSTSWNIPIINEAYINFGFFGVIIISFLLGLVVRFFSTIFSINNFNNAESHIGVYLCCSTFFWESHISLVYGGIYYPIIFLYITMFSLIYFLNSFIK